MYNIQLCVRYIQDFQGITMLRRHDAKKHDDTLAVEMAQNLPHLLYFSPSPPPLLCCHQISTHGKMDHLVTMVTGIECPSRVHILLHAHTRIRPVLGKETKSSWIYYQVYCERQTCCTCLHPCFCLHGGAHSVKHLVITGILCAASNRESEVS